MVLYSFLLCLGVLPMGKVMLQCLPAPPGSPTREAPVGGPAWFWGDGAGAPASLVEMGAALVTAGSSVGTRVILGGSG